MQDDCVAVPSHSVLTVLLPHDVQSASFSERRVGGLLAFFGLVAELVPELPGKWVILIKMSIII